jgi:hypothetical protein
VVSREWADRRKPGELNIDDAPVNRSGASVTQAGDDRDIDTATLTIAAAHDMNSGAAEADSGEGVFHGASLLSIDPAPDTHSAAPDTHSGEGVKNDV